MIWEKQNIDQVIFITINNKKMLELLAKTREYLDYVERHYNNVQKAWKELNEKCKGHGFNWLYDDVIWHEINENIKIHDASKLSRYEFVNYRQFFYPTKDEVKDKELMDYGWQHHVEQNPHHWQNWTIHHPNSIVYLIENICDWMAMGYEFGDTAKEYYENNKSKIDLPKWAIDEMYKIFDIIYSE